MAIPAMSILSATRPIGMRFTNAPIEIGIVKILVNEWRAGKGGSSAVNPDPLLSPLGGELPDEVAQAAFTGAIGSAAPSNSQLAAHQGDVYDAATLVVRDHRPCCRLGRGEMPLVD